MLEDKCHVPEEVLEVYSVHREIGSSFIHPSVDQKLKCEICGPGVLIRGLDLTDEEVKLVEKAMNLAFTQGVITQRMQKSEERIEKLEATVEKQAAWALSILELGQPWLDEDEKVQALEPQVDALNNGQQYAGDSGEAHLLMDYLAATKAKRVAGDKILEIIRSTLALKNST